MLEGHGGTVEKFIGMPSWPSSVRRRCTKTMPCVPFAQPQTFALRLRLWNDELDRATASR